METYCIDVIIQIIFDRKFCYFCLPIEQLFSTYILAPIFNTKIARGLNVDEIDYRRQNMQGYSCQMIFTEGVFFSDEMKYNCEYFVSLFKVSNISYGGSVI